MRKVRIPSVALATLVLGCGDDSDSTDTSDARIDGVASAICEQEKACDPEFEGTVEECVADFKAGSASISTGCLDALLDYYDCYVELTCEELEDEETKCHPEEYAAACEGEFEEEEDDLEE